MVKKITFLIIVLLFISNFVFSQTTIYEIQYTTEEGDGTYPSLHSGETVETTGIVTAVDEYPGSYYIQDGEGAWNGILVFDSDNIPQVGDEVTVTGLVEEYFGLTELKEISGYSVNSSGNDLPAVTEILTSASVNDEQWEGVLVSVSNVECTALPDGYGQWYVNGDLQIDDDVCGSGVFTPIINQAYNITGVVDYSYDEYALHPRTVDDIQVYASVYSLSKSFKLYPNPVYNILNISCDEMISNIEILNIVGQKVMNIDNVNSKNYFLDIENLNSDIYIANIFNKNGTSVTVKFIKK